MQDKKLVLADIMLKMWCMVGVDFDDDSIVLILFGNVAMIRCWMLESVRCF
jgi:hypothetical protein